MYEQLSRALYDFEHQDGCWETLVHQAEHQGVASLLYKHLARIDFVLPDGWDRILRSLYQRTRLSNQIRNRCAAEIISLLQQRQVAVLALKGIALGNCVYDDPSWRPMRDIDLLVGAQDADRAERCLVDCGYRQDQLHAVDDDHYHLPPLVKNVEELPVSVELHHHLLPLDGNFPRWPLEKCNKAAMSISIGAAATATLGLEDNLYYLYLHGLRAPLSYEPFRLVHIADLVSLVERYSEQIDWTGLQEALPQLRVILSRLHFITPWPDKLLSELALDIGSEPQGCGEPYSGWPLIKFKNVSASALPALLKDTLWPPQWWTQVHYGQIDGTGYYRVRLFDHPRTVWRWIKGSIRQRTWTRA